MLRITRTCICKARNTNLYNDYVTTKDVDIDHWYLFPEPRNFFWLLLHDTENVDLKITVYIDGPKVFVTLGSPEPSTIATFKNQTTTTNSKSSKNRKLEAPQCYIFANAFINMPLLSSELLNRYTTPTYEVSSLIFKVKIVDTESYHVEIGKHG